jgi:hypothetical protein
MSRNFSFNDAIGLVLEDEDDDNVVLHPIKQPGVFFIISPSSKLNHFI